MPYKQYKLKSGDMERICWLDRIDLKKGKIVTLKKDPVGKDRKWTVVEVYEIVEKEAPWRTWHVGGL